MDEMLLEYGGNLSGGEAKLIQLARGIYRDCDLYLIDEPLNYIDKDYTEMVLQVMGELFTEKTLVIISHDMRAFSLCDRVYTMADGTFGISDAS